jgi:hypothetical protein
MEISYNRNDYICTLEYKMFVILCAMMRMACRTTSEYAEEIRRRRAMENVDHDGYVFDRDFVTLADAGYVRVNISEVDVLISYVSKVYGFNPMKMKKVVEKVALEASFKDGVYKDALGIAKAVSRVISMME